MSKYKYVIYSVLMLSAFSLKAQDEIPVDSLRVYAEKQGKFIGTSVADGDGLNFFSSVYKYPKRGACKTIIANFNMIVAGNEMKYDAMEPSEGVFNFEKADILCDFAQAQGMAVRGHTLCWHSQLPTWMGAGTSGTTNTNNYTREQLLALLENHITTIVSRYKGRVKEWDVVNEPFDGNGNLRNSIWKDVIGEDFIDSAFVYAHRADPDALLYLNEYGNEERGSNKADGMYKFVKAMVERDIPIDGVGMQCHLDISSSLYNSVGLNIKRYGEIGLNCIITELDIAIPVAQFNTDAALEKQASNYRRLTELMLTYDNCPSLIIWGFSDAYSWIPGHSNNTKGQALIFDANLGKKPAYYAIRNKLAGVADDTGLSGVSAVKVSKDIRYSVTDNEIHILSTDNEFLPSQVKAYSLSGSAVNVGLSDIQAGVIDVSMLPAGAYFFVLSDENSSIYKFKFLKH